MIKELLVVGSTGFALFSMFFGSGNLVFPIRVGLESEGHFGMASLGVLCTCVIFPLLGMLGMTLYQGRIDEFFGAFGKKGVFLFSLLALALMGPFGVLARCLTVIHGALQLLTPDVSLPVTSFITCMTIFFLAANKTRIITLLGTFLTPILLATLGAIVWSALNQGTTLAITLAIAFFVSTLEFSGIASFLGPILEAIYPALIILTWV